MDTILPTNETSEFEGRLYLNPQIQLDESSNFIDNLRATQTQQNQEIAQQTHNLGTDIPSNLGGLTGGESYFTSRYQTPQTNAVTANLRAVAQAQALNQALENEQEMWKKRYNDAYRNYQKSLYDKNNPSNDDEDYIEYEDTEQTTGLNAEQDMNRYGVDTTLYNSTEVAGDSRSTEREKNIGVTKDKNGNISSVSVNGVTYYGREAKARYRYLKNAGLVR